MPLLRYLGHSAFLLEAEEPGALCAPDQLGPGTLRQIEEVESVGPACRPGLTPPLQLLQRVLPHALQQPVADFRPASLHLDEALVDERSKGVEHPVRGRLATVLSVAGEDHGLGVVHGEARRKDTQAPEEGLLALVE